jgi:basic membrane lipoprotein Med (substrate-binding protein (PBP1-ABC) superfamily)
MKSLNKFVVIFSVLMLILSIAPMISAQGDIESACLVTDLGHVDDGTFNQFAYEGGLAAAEDFDLDYEYIETASTSDYDANIQTCVDEGFDIIVTVGYLINDATATAAAANPDIYFIGVDQSAEGATENFVGIQYREDQAGFLVGAMAALLANDNEADVIAGVYGINVPAVIRYRNGYEQGALYVNPDWEIGTNILGVYADSFIDEAQGISLSQQLMGEGAFVVFGAGGPTGTAGIKEAALQGVYVIGVDQDEYYSSFSEGETEGAEYLFTSALKRVDQGVYDMIAAVAEDDMESFPGGANYLLSLENGGIGFGPQHDAVSVSEEIYTIADEILEGLLSDDIVTNVDPVSGLTYCDASQYREDEGCVEPEA